MQFGTMNKKSTRFLQKPEVFQYTDQKQTSVEDEEWLLASPADNDRMFSAPKRQPNVQDSGREVVFGEKQGVNELVAIIQHRIQDDQVAILQREYDNFMKKIENQKKEKEHIQQKTRSNKDAVVFEKSVEKEKMSIKLVEQKLEKSIQQNKKDTHVEKHNQNIIDQIQNKPQIKQVQKKKKQRVTMNMSQWLKVLAPQPIEKTIQNKQVPMQIENLPPPPAKVQNRRATARFGSRVTIDMKSISAMLEENYNKYETLSSNKQKQILSGPTGRKSFSIRSEQNNIMIQKYFENLNCEPSQAQKAEEKLYSQLKQASEKRLKQSQLVLHKIQKQAKALEDELRNIPSDNDEEVFTLNDFQQIIQPFRYFEYHYAIQILSFEVNENDTSSVYCEFILDENIFCKLKKQDQNKKAQIRIAYSTIIELNQTEQMMDTRSKIQLLKLYFVTYLDKLPAFEILRQIGIFYKEFKVLEDDLERCCSVFAVKSLELSRTCEKLTFQLTIKPKTNLLITIKLLSLLEENYYEIYHIEGRKQIIIPECLLKGDDLIDIIQALIDCVP